MRPRLSVLLPTGNSAATVRNTLASVNWADELLVVDSFSTDSTLAICGEFGARILQHEYRNSAAQKNWALPRCLHEWVLQIDSDEELSPGLREEICTAILNASPAVKAFRIPRRNHFLGRWMRHGGVWPDYQIRLFRRDDCRWADREVHAHLQVPGEIITLTQPFIHHDGISISRRFRDLDRYTRYEADELHKRGIRFHWYDLPLRPWAGFFYRYLWLQGFRDGWRGLIFCAYLAVYIFLVRAKLWEMQTLGLAESPRLP